jgi:luciferase family oxidoreductase group 1
MPRYRLGVLDQSPIAAGRTPADAIAETIELAQLAEQLGYERYWLAEHHASESFAGSCPELLAAHVAQSTRSIRVGTGGVMLMHCSALEVAEQFRLLETLHPGRIDLGIGRAPGADAHAIRALCPNDGEPDVAQRRFETKLRELTELLRSDTVHARPSARVFAQPRGPGMPEPWLLGSGTTSAMLAAKLGWSFCFAQFISGATGALVVDTYREAFVASPWLDRPRVAVGCFVLVGDDDAQAERLISSTELWFLNLQLGRSIPFPTPEQALAHAWDGPAAAMRRQLRALRIHGGPQTVSRDLERLATLYDTDELMIVTITHDHQARLRSYRRLAEIAGLKPNL